MKQKTKSNSFTARPRPPTIDQICEDIFMANEHDPIFNILKRARSGFELSSQDSEPKAQPLTEVSEFMKKLNYVNNVDFLKELSNELQHLCDQLAETNKLVDTDKPNHENNKPSLLHQDQSFVI